MKALLKRRIDQLRPMAMPAELEPEARVLGEEICCGSRSLWPIDGARLREDSDYRVKFYGQAHAGMWSAQNRFLHRIESESKITPAEAVLYRTAMDSIAWQMLETQLCFARQVYREKRQPNLDHSNLKSVVAAANWVREQSPEAMPLICDLTTFVQIGDIFCLDPRTGSSIIEVKQGDHNHKVLKLAHLYRHSRRDDFKDAVRQLESPGTYKQFERTLRQMERMEFARNVLASNVANDPDSGRSVLIPKGYVPIGEWHGELVQTISDAKERGWAINVIDDCLFLGCYTDPEFIRKSPIAFLPWLDHFAGDEFSPVARLIDCARIPLALPMYLLPLPHDYILDLMFGRLQVCLGVSLPGLVAECAKHGIEARPATKRERKMILEARGRGVNFQGRPLVLQRGDRSMVVADGIFMRMLCHFQRPISLISALLETPSEESAD